MVDFELIHPREQIVMLMSRIYRHGMTTTSGGNLSVRDFEGNIWISPAGVDKGTLRPQDIVCVHPDGSIEGIHKPSSEYPFHRAIYEARPDLRGILHAHPSALVAFSIVRKIPDTRIIPQARDICRAVGYADYALPGSQKLGSNIAAKFKQQFDCVLLENHGVVCGGDSLLEAYQRFETLDFCARLWIKASGLGQVRTLSDDQLRLLRRNRNYLPEFRPETRSSREKELRKAICDIVHRASAQHIMTSTEGSVSVRLTSDAFLITPYGIDRGYLEPADIVLIHDGQRENGKIPSRSVVIHKTMYDQHPGMGAIVLAQPPNAMAYGVTPVRLDTRTIPESYIVLRDIPKLPFGVQADESDISAAFSDDSPVVMIENDALLATGQTLIQAYDRLEVAEFTARSLLNARPLGELVAINPEQIKEIDKAFLGK